MDIQKIITLIEQYEATPRNIVSANIRRLTKTYKISAMSGETSAARQTIYHWTKIEYGSKPTFVNALRLCLILKIDISELIQPINGIEIEDDRPMCCVDGCTNKANAAKGLCWTHYQAERRKNSK